MVPYFSMGNRAKDTYVNNGRLEIVAAFLSISRLLEPNANIVPTSNYHKSK